MTVELYCMFCAFQTTSFNEHLSHHHHHRHINRSRFHCGYLDCRSVLTTERLLRLHSLRVHLLKVKKSLPPASVPTPNGYGKYLCTVTTCRQETENYPVLLKHLKKHIGQGVVITCPHPPCHRKYAQLNSFTSHLSKKHRAVPTSSNLTDNGPLLTDSESNFFEPGEDFAICEREQGCDGPLQFEVRSNPLNCYEKSEEESIMRNFAQFCMKLEYHYLVPEKTVQFSVDEIFKIQSQSKQFFQGQLLKTLKSENLPIGQVNRIAQDTFSKDPFEKQYNQNWSSCHRRKNFYKETFSFVTPQKIEYVKTIVDKNGVQKNVKTFFYYVDVEKTLEYSFTVDKSLNLDLKPAQSRTDGLLADVTDGKAFKDNSFFKENPISIRIVIYQDGVEIVNAIGSAKRVHKLLAIYLSIINLPDHLRSHINSIKLVALVKEKHFDHQIVFGKIVKDLKVLETRGLKLNGQFVKVGLVCVTGDNLGSHSLGGFVENFSKALYFCRYCHIDRLNFHSEDGECARFELRTVESYNHCVQMVAGKKKKNYKGVKFDSVFNQLDAFHVCQPGLPCCAGHDLFEGFVAYDLFIFISYFVNIAEWFTYHELNESIASFPYSTEDRKDKPIPVQEDSDKIKGGAWQIWTLLRLFPLIMLDYIADDQSEVFRALILLTEIVEIICSPVIHESHLPYLQTIIEEYLTMRKECFPHINLRPKHHYLSHYPWLIYMFGPALKVWTLRFESKHTFFKRVARVIRNFKNILLSLAMKHELLQCYLRSGADFRSGVEVFGASDLSLNTYAASVRNAISRACPNMTEMQECNVAVVKGTIYKKSDIIVINQDSYDGKLFLGRIIIILFDCHESVYFLCEELDTTFDIRKRLYTLGVAVGYKCVKADQLLTYYPHKPYFGSYIKLKHAIVSKPA